MPLSTYSILLPPYVALTQATLVTDIQNIQPLLNQAEVYNVGDVDTVNYLCNRVKVGSQYLYRQTDAVLVTAGGTDYYIVKEQDCITKQIIPV